MQQEIIKKLEGIQQLLESQQMDKQENWTHGAQLACEGFRLSKNYKKMFNEELGSSFEQYFTNKIEMYLEGKRSDVYTRRIILISFSKEDTED